MITKFGKRFLTNLIAGNTKSLNKDIAIGIDLTEATENDTRLGFEFYRVPALFGSTEIQTVDNVSTYSVIFKASIPQDVEGEINEIGLYPSDRSSINKFYSSSTEYFEYEITPPAGTGDQITEDISMSLIYAGATNPAPDKSLINKIGITITPSGTDTTYVGFDGLRINDEDTFDPFFGLISRSVVINTTTISGSSGENTIEVDSINNLFIGQKVSGTGIATGATITNIEDNTITLSSNNTAAVSGNGSFYGIKKVAGRSLDIEYKLDLDWN